MSKVYTQPSFPEKQEKRSNQDRRQKNRRGKNTEPLWGELIKELGPEIKDFLITTAESHKRMTDAQELRTLAENRMSDFLLIFFRYV
ncbi:MAG: hypothetical protein ABIK15_10675 [Pseudomonadota bacterium]